MRKAIVVTSLSFAAGGGYLLANDEGSKRSATFWINVFPIYLHYRGYQLLNRDLKIMSDEVANKIYDELHEKYTNCVKDLTYKLRGFYLKQAQLMSVQDDFVPKAYMTWCKDTQDNVPSEFSSSQDVREYVASKLLDEKNLKFDDIFSYWDDKPLGVASIGQCHRAILKKTGEEVAVKILCPGMEERFRADIKTIKTFCSLAMPQHVSALEEIERAFLTEFNYIKEATCLNKVRDNVLPKYGSVVSIPKGI
jgi:aarF domain-containing kinase